MIVMASQAGLVSLSAAGKAAALRVAQSITAQARSATSPQYSTQSTHQYTSWISCMSGRVVVAARCDRPTPTTSARAVRDQSSVARRVVVRFTGVALAALVSADDVALAAAPALAAALALADPLVLADAVALAAGSAGAAAGAAAVGWRSSSDVTRSCIAPIEVSATAITLAAWSFLRISAYACSSLSAAIVL